jgi:hypothetical protein
MMDFLEDLELEERQIIYPSPENPRLKGLTPEESSIKALADSIKKDGQLQRIIVQKNGDRYDTIDGDRRCVAIFKVLKWKTIKASVYQMTKHEASRLRLIANIQKEDLSPTEKGHYCFYLFRIVSEEEQLDPDKSWTSTHMRSKILATVSKETGVSAGTILNWISLWNQYPPEAQRLIASNPDELRQGLVPPSLAISAAHVARRLNVSAYVVLKQAIDSRWTSENLDYIRRTMRQGEKISFAQVPKLIEDYKAHRVSRQIAFLDPCYNQTMQRCKRLKMRFEDYVNSALEFALTSTSFQESLRQKMNREITKIEREA